MKIAARSYPTSRPDTVLAVVTGQLLNVHEPESSALFARAAELYHSGACHIEVLHVVPLEDHSTLDPESSRTGSDAVAEQNALNELLVRANRRFDTLFRGRLVQSNDRAAAIMAIAARIGASYVLKQSSGPKTSSESVEADVQTDAELRRRATIPVWFVRSSSPVENLVAAVRGPGTPDMDFPSPTSLAVQI